MLQCNEVTRLYASDDIGRASLRTRLAVRLHLLMCRWCSRYVRELSAIGAATRGLARAFRPEPGRTDALVRRALPDPPHPRQ